MKKAYTKPEIIFDDFSLATTIAAGCENLAHLPTKDVCYVQFGTMKLFLSSVSACGDHVNDGDHGYCYHNPSDLTNLFNSL